MCIVYLIMLTSVLSRKQEKHGKVDGHGKQRKSEQEIMVDKEERERNERVQREAVQQHFEESLKLAQQKVC